VHTVHDTRYALMFVRLQDRSLDIYNVSEGHQHASNTSLFWE